MRWATKKIGVKSELVCEVQSLLNQAKETVRARRLILYRADMGGVVVAQDLLSAAEHSDREHEIVKILFCPRDNNGELESLVRWEGLPDPTNSQLPCARDSEYESV